MTETKKPQARRLRALHMNADGTRHESPIVYCPLNPETGQSYEGEPGETLPDGSPKPGVGFILRFIDRDEHRAIVQAHTRKDFDNDTRTWSEKIEHVKVGDAICRAAIVDWWGLDAVDGRPLPCTDVTKAAITDPTLRGEIQWRATRTLEPVLGVAAEHASFRESEGVRDVVGRLEQVDSVLSTGQREGTSH